MKTRDQIEGELHTALEFARQRYEECKKEASDRLDTGNASMGAPDGTLALRQRARYLAESDRALEEYSAALRAFNNFVLYGKVPPDMNHT